MYFGAQVASGKVTWIEGSTERPLHLTSASLFKQASKQNGRVVLQICEPEGEPSENHLSVALGVLSPKLTESINLDVLINSRMGLKIAGPDSSGAMVHVVGNELSPIEFFDEDDEEAIGIAPDVVDVEMVLDGDEMMFEDGEANEGRGQGENGEDSEDEDEDDSEDDIRAKRSGGEARKGQKGKNKGEKDAGTKDNDKAVVKRKPGGLPVVQHKSGLKMQDIVIGSGKYVKKGHHVAMHYVLRLENGKVIDRAERRKPFKFRLGIGECVKGFDIGVSGMREGGERLLIVPPHLGYGSHPPPGIPKDATLYFDVGVVKAY